MNNCPSRVRMFVNQNRMRASNFVLSETRSDTLLTKEMSLFNRGNFFFYLNMNSYRMMDIFSQFILVIIILHFNLNHLNEMIKCTLDLKNEIRKKSSIWLLYWGVFPPAECGWNLKVGNLAQSIQLLAQSISSTYAVHVMYS